MSRARYVIGNWKMNGTRDAARQLARAVAAGVEAGGRTGTGVVLCPPATLLAVVSAEAAAGRVALGGQDCHARASGAFTGDVSAEMLAEAGCRYVIVGHSERRTLHGEDDATVRAKAEAARRAGLVAVVCVGESLAEREAGRTAEVLARQVDGSVPDGAGPCDTLVAYEPVWPIRTGRVATPAPVAEAHAGIRARLGARLAGGAGMSLLYGGSVKPENAAELLALEDVDGALVGGASLDAAQFLAIVAASPR
ncbi:MAG: triose-phosphate isomerase [Alphaproteobacteria bacterium]